MWPASPANPFTPRSNVPPAMIPAPIPVPSVTTTASDAPDGGPEHPLADRGARCVVVDHDPSHTGRRGHAGLEVHPDPGGQIRREVHRPVVVDEAGNADAECGSLDRGGLPTGPGHQLRDHLRYGSDDSVGTRCVGVRFGSPRSSRSLLMVRQRGRRTGLADDSARGVECDAEHFRPTDVDSERQTSGATTAGGCIPGRSLVPVLHFRL